MSLLITAITAVTAIAATAFKVANGLAAIGLAVEGLKVLGNALLGVIKELGLIKQEDTVEDLGDKALQAEEAGIVPENFNSYAEYVRNIEEFKINPEKSKLIEEEKKVQKGIELTAGVTLEKFPELPIEEFFQLAGENSKYFTDDRMKELGKLISEEPKYISNMVKYMNGTEKNQSVLNDTIDSLKNIEKIIKPDISDEQAFQNILDIRK